MTGIKWPNFLLRMVLQAAKVYNRNHFNVNLKIAVFFSLQTCFILNLVNSTILYGKSPISNNLVTSIKVTGVTPAFSQTDEQQSLITID